MLRDFSYKLPGNIIRSFRGFNFLWHILAIILTYLLVTSGFDWWYSESVGTTWLYSFRLPAALLGFLIPIIVPVSLYFIGKARKSVALEKTAAVLGQAAVIGWAISSSYKAFTGRLHPELIASISNIDISRDFNFGFFKEGIFWGWPSSHTAVAFAMAAALIALYPRRKEIILSATIYATYIGLGVSVSIHWFSDVVAGAIIGSVIGLVVAKSYQGKPPASIA